LAAPPTAGSDRAASSAPGSDPSAMPAAENRRTGVRTLLIVGGVLLVAALLLGARQANRRR
ncbi:hypothetical protein ABZ507_22530, partial [Nocardia niwae]